MNRVLLTVTLCLLAPAGLTACGGTEARLSHQAYEQEMQAIARDMSARANHMAVAANAASADGMVELLEDARDLLRDGADRVGAINPPADIDRPHSELADALDDFVGLMDDMLEGMDDGDVADAMEIMEDARDLDLRFREAIAEIRAAGYNIGSDGDWN